MCYRKGGTEPTVTDANLVLGRLNPDYLLGGGVPLDAAAAGEAIKERCALPLDLDVITAAHGVTCFTAAQQGLTADCSGTRNCCGGTWPRR